MAYITNKPYAEIEGGFFIVPNNFGLICTELKLKPNDRLIYLCLLRFANNSDRNPFPSYKRIKDYTGISSDNTVSASIKRLEEVGLIAKLHKGTIQGDSNVYQVNYAYVEPQEQVVQRNAPGQTKTVKQLNQDSLIIPFRRGVHDSIVTSKEIGRARV